MLYLGGPPPPLPPSAPSAVGASTVGASTAGAIAAGASTAAGTEAPATTSPAPAPPEPDDSAYFKGVIQDVQISNGVNVSIVEFFPLQVPGLQLPPPFGEVQLEPGVLRGVVSDDLCAARPCLHNATCTNTWNDYTYVPRPAALLLLIGFCSGRLYSEHVSQVPVSARLQGQAVLRGGVLPTAGLSTQLPLPQPGRRVSSRPWPVIAVIVVSVV